MKTIKYPMLGLLGLVALIGILQPTTSYAHYLWIEPVDGSAHLCFGEYENTLREKTGGKLDNIAMPEVQTNPADGKRMAVSIQRKPDHIALQGTTVQALIAQEITMKVKDLSKHHMGIVKPMYYSRFAASEAEQPSSLVLDIQPVAPGKIRVNFRGKPLAKTKVSLYAPNQWMREYDTNEAGEISIVTPWPGLYVAEVAYIEPVAGEYQGDKYEGIRHVGTLSIMH